MSNISEMAAEKKTPNAEMVLWLENKQLLKTAKEEMNLNLKKIMFSVQNNNNWYGSCYHFIFQCLQHN